MASIPLPALGVKQPEQAPDLLSMYRAAQGIQQQQTQMQAQKIQLQQAQQAQKDQQTLGQLMIKNKGNLDQVIKDAPQAGVMPNTVLALQQHNLQVQQQQQNYTESQRKEAKEANDAAAGLIKPVLDETDPAKKDAAYQAGLQQIQANPKYYGITDPQQLAQIPQQRPPDDQLRVQMAMHMGQSAQMEADSKAAIAAKDNSEAAKNRYMNVNGTLMDVSGKTPVPAMSGNMQPQDWLKLVDNVVPPGGANNSLNMRTKSQVQFYLQQGNQEAAQKAINEAGQQVGAIEKETNPQVVNTKIAVAGAEARIKAQNDDSSVVAYDPNAKNPDGSKGGNVVMQRGQALQAGLPHYKVDASAVNSVVGGFNDVQNKINSLAEVANDPKRMSQVQGPLAAAMLSHKGLEVGAFGTHFDTSRVNEGLYSDDLKSANQATRDYVTATLAAHEAITQLPRLQTFGKSSRMTEQQMQSAQAMLPRPGDDAGMAAQKMNSLQTTLDPLRKQVPRMQGAELTPSWLEKSQNGANNPSGGGKEIHYKVVNGQLVQQ
jgi:hypothetical protein